MADDSAHRHGITVALLIDGGKGRDTCAATDNVTVRNCEDGGLQN